MSHHAEHDSEFPEAARELFDKRLGELTKQVGAGPTGEFPRGKLHRTDEGAIRIVVTVEHNTVILAFGKPVAWIGMSRIEAIQLADLLKTQAETGAQ